MVAALVNRYVNDNRAFSTLTAPGGVLTLTNNNFEYKNKVDPSVWLGYRSECGLGFTATKYTFAFGSLS